MSPPSPRPSRPVGIAAHLWDTYEEMARQVGCEPDALIHQALFMFARLNGFDPASALEQVVAPPPAATRRTPPTQEVLPVGQERTPLPPTSGRATPPEGLTAVAGATRWMPEERTRAEEDDEEGSVLFLMLEGCEPRRVTKDRFVIGRGKHCDLVVESGKVSREHAVIVRDAEGYLIEDLNSSNGTLFEGQRIRQRRLEDGDEYVLCDRKMRVLFG